MKDKNYLYNMYNATSTGDENGELESYENWLERQLLARIERLEQCDIHGVVSSSDLIVVELSDEEIKIIERQELEQWRKDALEFDGFEGWLVRGKLVKGI